MGMPCKFYGCKNRAKFYARNYAWAISPYVPEPVNLRLHPYCDDHVRRVEQRYESKLWAREDSDAAS